MEEREGEASSQLGPLGPQTELAIERGLQFLASIRGLMVHGISKTLANNSYALAQPLPLRVSAIVVSRSWVYAPAVQV